MTSDLHKRLEDLGLMPVPKVANITVKLWAILLESASGYRFAKPTPGTMLNAEC